MTTLDGVELPRGLRVVVAGGSRTKDLAVREFAEALGAEIVAGNHKIPIVLITAGKKAEEALDSHVVRGATRTLRGKAEEIHRRLITLPSPEGPVDYSGTPFEHTRLVPGKAETTNAVRRHKMVSIADAVIALAGTRVGTGGCIDLAIARSILTLPLAFCGGHSKKAWEEYGTYLADRYDKVDWKIPAWTRAEFDEACKGRGGLKGVCRRIVTQVRKHAIADCFVMMPYEDPSARALCERVLVPALEDAAMRFVLSSQSHETGHVVDQMLAQIRDADVCLALLTDRRRGRPPVNANVVYEVGYARALNIPTVMLVAKDTPLADRPFDLRSYRTIEYATEDLRTKAKRNALVSEVSAALREART